MSAAALLAAIAYGLASAWAAEVLVRAVPDRVRPGLVLRCTHCAAAFPRVASLPVIGWFTGRSCPSCGTPRPRRVVWQDIAALGASVLVCAAGMAPLVTLAWLAFVPVAVALASIDLELKRLPDLLTLPSAAAVLVLLAFDASVRGSGMLVTTVASSAALFCVYLVMNLVTRGGMGMGDVKLALVLGALLGVLGAAAVLVATLLAFVLGGLISSVLLLARRASRKSTIPFGPFMILAAFATLPLGNPILNLLGM